MARTAPPALLIAAALIALPAYADDADELARLREEAAALRQYLDTLDAKIEAMGGAKAPAADKRPVPTVASLQRSWSQVRPGISQERVDALLGKPERVMRINGDLVWYYVYPDFGRASVFFNAQDKVTATQPPRTGWF